MLSIDGSSGAVYLGEVAVVASPVVEYFEGGLDPSADELVTAVHTLMQHADARRRLGVRANSDNGEDSARAVRFGAQGIGLTRTEHMFLGDRRQLVENLILAEDEVGRTAALDALEPLQRGDFVEILEAMDGLPVTIRLLDPPLHEFLPDLTELSVKIALAGDKATEKDRKLLEAVRRLHEQNPMLGLRGVRLGLVIPGLFAMQVRAIAQAAADRVKAGGDPQPEIMIPLVGAVQELEIVREEAERVLAEVAEETGAQVHTLIGTMIEVPRAALTAGQIAEAAEFFSFGTNDLTQMGWGFSRDDVEGAFFSRYIDLGIFGVTPFETLDPEGVGRLVQIAVEEGRATRPDLKLGVCGEHGGDPDSVHFFHQVGPGLRVLLAVPGAGGPAGGGPGGGLESAGQRQPVTRATTSRRRSGGLPSRRSMCATPGAVLSSGTAPGCCIAPRCAGWRPRRRSSRAGSGDFPRTRLTHSLECAQIGRELGAVLGRDPDLVDAACLAHDLGHPPFGHNGESALAAAGRGLRRVRGQRAEPAAAHPAGGQGPGAGLNLTRATLDARSSTRGSALARAPAPGQVRRLRRRRRDLRLDPGGRARRAALPGGPGHGLGRRRGLLGARPGGRAARRADPARPAARPGRARRR